MHDLRDVGGTPGGFGPFLVGLALLAAGVYLLFQQVDVHGGYWQWGSSPDNTFGLTLIPLLVGVGILFYDGASKLGWVVAGLGLLIIVAGVVANLRIHFRTTSLWNAVSILALIAGGIGVIARSLRPAGRGREDRDDD